MNEVIRQLAARRSVRAFEDRDIPGEVRAAILEAAAQAPTAGNQQLYTILDVTDPQLKARLAETCDHQPFIAQAPMVLIFLADVCKWLDAYREAGCEPRAPGAGDVMLAASDAAIAAQNADKLEVAGEKLTEEEYALGIAKDSDLLKKANKVIAELKEEGKIDAFVSNHSMK